MSEYVPEQPTQIDTVFVPQTDEPLEPVDAVAALEQALEAQPSAVDLVLAEAEPPPLGRSWWFDWQARRFLTGGRSPLQVRGMQTLGVWVEKCLRTARGAHAIHPAGYGLPTGSEIIGGPAGVVPADLEERIRDALTFHPRITDIRGFTYDYTTSEDFLAVSFTAVIDGGAEELPFRNLQLAL